MGVGQKQAKAFMVAKDALQDDTLLVHYGSSKQLVLAYDASPYGLGAVLSHVMNDSLEKPIAYASRMLTAAEKNYSQLERDTSYSVCSGKLPADSLSLSLTISLCHIFIAILR